VPAPFTRIGEGSRSGCVAQRIARRACAGVRLAKRKCAEVVMGVHLIGFEPPAEIPVPNVGPFAGRMWITARP